MNRNLIEQNDCPSSSLDLTPLEYELRRYTSPGVTPEREITTRHEECWPGVSDHDFSATAANTKRGTKFVTRKVMQSQKGQFFCKISNKNIDLNTTID
ncbi:hypothetical protein TNCV_2993571 [Trichonephila clavipes]|nr:hypothetical protein TNCV_2993571 [Trichonephila clavipes]